MTNSFLSAIEGLMRGICNQKPHSDAPSRNVQIVTSEIDYDKLAKAIVQANKESEKGAEKVDSASSVLCSFAVIIFTLYGAVIVAVMIAVVMASVDQLREMIWNSWSQIGVNIVVLGLAFLMALVLLVFAVLSFRAAKEVSREENRSYIAAVVSALSGMTALIVALVALFR